jgi:hypothetical protein
MRNILNPFRFVVIAFAGWMNPKQQYAIDYLREENRVLREQLGTRRLRFTADQRRRLAVAATSVVVPVFRSLTCSNAATNPPCHCLAAAGTGLRRCQ